MDVQSRGSLDVDSLNGEMKRMLAPIVILETHQARDFLLKTSMRILHMFPKLYKIVQIYKGLEANLY